MIYPYAIVIVVGILLGLTNKEVSQRSLLIGIFVIPFIVGFYVMYGLALDFDVTSLLALQIHHQLIVHIAFLYAIELALIIKLIRKLMKK